MAKFSDKSKNGALIATALVVVALILFWFLRPKNANGQGSGNSGNCPICNFLSGLSGPAGTTNPGALNGNNSTSGTPNPAFQTYNYNVPIPSFHYSGNSQIYMPLFGFVGYSSTGTM